MSQLFGSLKRPPEVSTKPEFLPDVIQEDVKSFATTSGDLKRRRLDNPSSSSTSTTSPPLESYLPSIPLLFHLATSAHHASHQHLQQVFIPSFVNCEGNDGYPPIISARPGRTQSQIFTHDEKAGDKAIGLLLLALDLLRAGLLSTDLSEKERVAFSLEYGTIGMKVLTACGSLRTKSELVAAEKLDHLRLRGEVEDAVASGVYR